MCRCTFHSTTYSCNLESCITNKDVSTSNKVCGWLGPGYTSINSEKNAFNPYNSVTKILLVIRSLTISNFISYKKLNNIRFLNNIQQYSTIKQMNKYSIDFFYMHLFTMRSQCVLNRSSNQDAHYSCPR
jgi:hypothetical protein